MRVPKSFPLLGHTITVRIVPNRDWEELAERYEDMEDAVGLWCADDNLIVLLRQKRSALLHAFFHELMHAVLHYMSSPLTNDEVFVDTVGGLLAQAIESQKR
jgi:hypothetical protein